ncbi:MAG: hypothetical protein FP825_06870 [Hyphomonas sp.]|uniref:hypothetical protein n=1 Tax=Hyphomonas sp. TaxID=87 RepID=UPI00180E35A0|nr:hypothetical protein [Hyphomonas sp.]MBA3068183.1 hypothetical protein [Hyphomonas sp.]MBU3922391.1 hypothetical protein [Alphaproteobacteria bacterium]MBU4062105.1 hypothetical protein [Alphaproteobacteria bacterium]MBU4165539.1 hypothetical protein [Alphaproteobacteria bacterium]
MSKKTFGIVATCICWALALTYFLGPKNSFIEFLPPVIVYFLAYSIFKYDKPQDEVAMPLVGILVVFYGYWIFTAYDSIENRRSLRELYRECERQQAGFNEGDPFYEQCNEARDWYYWRYIEPNMD